MHRSTHALLVIIALTLTALTVHLDQRSLGRDLGWAAYACDFAISGASACLLVRMMAHVIRMWLQTRARIRELQGMLASRPA